MRALPAIACLALGLPTLAAAEAWHCVGSDPEWTLRFDETEAEFVFPATTRMDVVQQRRAENRDWPLVLSLIGERDTAIVLVEPLECRSDGDPLPFRALVLTQRGQTPLLLAGCCEAPR